MEIINNVMIKYYKIINNRTYEYDPVTCVTRGLINVTALEKLGYTLIQR